eukprot:6174801-Pleurochrysis_carterae.AAC.1
MSQRLARHTARIDRDPKDRGRVKPLKGERGRLSREKSEELLIQVRRGEHSYFLGYKRSKMQEAYVRHECCQCRGKEQAEALEYQQSI